MKNKSAISISILLIVTLLATSVFSAFATTNPNIFANAVIAKAGETVKIPVEISNNSGLAGLKLKFDYDDTKLTPTSVEAGDSFVGGFQDNIDGDAEVGSFNVYWASSTGDNVNANGILMYLNFEISSTAIGKTSIGVSYDQADTFDEDFNDVKLNCENINLVIGNENGTPPTLSLIAPAKIEAGQLFELKLHAENISSETNAKIKMVFDNSNYSLYTMDGVLGDSISNISFVDGVEFNCTLDSTNNNSDILSLTFLARDTCKNKDYSFELYADGFITEGCTVTVENGASDVTPIVYIPSAMGFDGLIAENNKNISIPVMIDCNTGLMGYRLTIGYNPNELQVLSVSNGASFSGGLYDSIGNKANEFDVIWNSTANNNSNGVLFYINCKTVANINNEAILSAITITYNQGDTFDEDYGDVELNCKNGKVEICSGHNCELSELIDSDCLTGGSNQYRCKYCHYSCMELVPAKGHYYIYEGAKQTSIKDFTMIYRCMDCNDEYITNGDDVFSLWNSSNTKYINAQATRKDINSQLLDANNDGIINAKDYAMIVHAHNSK